MIRVAFTALALGHPGALIACACCADPGERSLIEHAIHYAGDVPSAMSRAKEAHLFTTECYMDCVEGIDPADDFYDLQVTTEDNSLSLTLNGENGAGVLYLSLPATFTQFKVDTEPHLRPNTTLYVERRFTVSIDGTDAFETSSALVGELVLSGVGNHCEDATFATHWSLSVDAASANYRLFGSLAN